MVPSATLREAKKQLEANGVNLADLDPALHTYTIKSIIVALSRHTNYYHIPDGQTKSQAEVAQEVCDKLHSMLNEVLEEPAWKDRFAEALPPPPPPPPAGAVGAAALPPTPPALNTRDLTAAWAVLQNPKQIREADALSAALDDLGIYDEINLGEILDYDAEQVKVVLKFLKPTGASQFSRALGWL